MWNDGACGENCPIGSILFNDFTCSDDVVSGKTPIGVVIYKDGKGAGQAMALKSIGDYEWGGFGTDISTLPNLSQSQASQDVASCENSKKIMAAGNKSTYPAVWAANEYKTEGTSAGDWCLPAAGIFNSYRNNQDVINTGFSRANGTKFTNRTYAWSSSEGSSGNAWRSYFSNGYGLLTYGKDTNRKVRPVVGFCDDMENYVYDQATDSCVKDSACRLGSIFYSDKTCSMKLKDDKTPIGVVVYVDESGTKAQVMALETVEKTSWEWARYSDYVDISTLPNYTSYEAASQDYASCENSKQIRAQVNNSEHTYSAVWAAYNYSTEGTDVGDWCLPAAGIFTSIYNNPIAVNLGFEKAGGETLTNTYYAWSSSEYDSGEAWRLVLSNGYGLGYNGKSNSNEVRPVLEGNLTSEGDGFCLNSYQYTCDGANETGGSSTSCGGKFQSCNCASGYEWNGSSCVCPSTYKYTCSGTGYSGGSGTACGGKYAACVCKTPYKWNGSSCACPSTYKYTCTGANQTGGSGTACGGKYTKCTCDSGYRWDSSSGSCVEIEWGTCNGLAAKCSLGNILFSDGTCSANKGSGKTPIAVVVYKSGSCGQAMALKSIGDYKWSTEYVDISGLTNYTLSSTAKNDFASCENSAKIRAQRNRSTYPAVWAAYNYTTTGTKLGDWCLPAAGIFTSIYNNQSTINTGFSRANGTQFTNSTYAWSSSENDSNYVWTSFFHLEYGLNLNGKRSSSEVRPVIEF